LRSLRLHFDLRSRIDSPPAPLSSYNELRRQALRGIEPVPSLFQFRQSLPNSQISSLTAVIIGPDASMMDKIAQLKEILALDPKNSFARYGMAMELVNRGESAAALSEFDILLSNDPDYTPGYFMAAQTLAGAGRKAEAAARLKDGIASASRSGNSHALNEMQAMLDEMLR
jgi:predicted Zn-dependent protease